MNTPFFNGIAKLAQNKTRFFVPGHKGNPLAIPAFAPVLPFDITEVAGADDLCAPSGILAQSQNNMAKAFGSGATLYSAFGSSSCILAMITMFAKTSPNIIMARGCHISAIRALAFTGLRPVWVLPENGRVNPADIEHALRTSGAKTVYVTSPTYQGQMCNISAIASICKKYAAALLVDNAHGAYLRFITPDTHPLSLGADATADSAHKTLPCLTPGALLHLKAKENAAAARDALNMYCSTSPSYLVLQSLDIAAGLLVANKINFAPALGFVQGIKQAHPHLVCQNCDDPLKIVLRPEKAGHSTAQLNAALIKGGILPEMCSTSSIVLMASPYNTKQDFSLLSFILAGFKQQAALVVQPPPPFVLPQAACSVRQASFAEKERIPASQALHRIAACTSAPCPPGVPILVPGERISQNSLRFFAHAGIESIDVVK